MDNRRVYPPYRQVCAGGSCSGANGGENNGYNCADLLERIRQTDFAILDAVLYLDV